MDDSPEFQKALARFAAKVRFDSRTGCVIWTAGTSDGRAGTVKYGAFRYEGKRWPAHRWAGVFIHGIDASNGNHITHDKCENTLCVQHVKGMAEVGNSRQYWTLVAKGYEEGWPVEPLPEPTSPPGTHPMPDWLKPFVEKENG